MPAQKESLFEASGGNAIDALTGVNLLALTSDPSPDPMAPRPTRSSCNTTDKKALTNLKRCGLPSRCRTLRQKVNQRPFPSLRSLWSLAEPAAITFVVHY
jgi:hypothetical protein